MTIIWLSIKPVGAAAANLLSGEVQLEPKEGLQLSFLTVKMISLKY